MSADTYNAITMALGIAILFALAASVISFGLMIFRWKGPQRRKHAIRLLIFLASIPCLIGVHLANLWLVFLPALHRDAIAKHEAQRADHLAETSLVHVGDRAPAFELTDTDGSKFSLSDAKGKVVVINFFATWCGPCLLELPHIEKVWKDLRSNENFQLLVIGREETIESVREFRSGNAYSFPLAPDPDRHVYSLFAKEGVPRTIVISPSGVIVYSKAGFYEHDLDELRSVLEEQFAGAKYPD